MGASAEPVVLTQNEYMRRMKEMAALQPGMSFYGDMPDSYTVVVNTDSPLVATDLEKASTEAREQQNKAIDDYAATAPRVAQMVDLALLGNGLLRGADLSRFIARSFELMA